VLRRLSPLVARCPKLTVGPNDPVVLIEVGLALLMVAALAATVPRIARSFSELTG